MLYSHVLYSEEQEKADKPQIVIDCLPKAGDQEQLVYIAAFSDSLPRSLSRRHGGKPGRCGEEGKSDGEDAIEELGVAEESNQAPEILTN